MPQDGQQNLGLEKAIVDLNATPSDSKERHKAARAAQFTAGGAVVCLAIAVIAAIKGDSGIGWTAAGLCVALFVVAAMLMFDSERQRRVGPPNQPLAR